MTCCGSPRATSSGRTRAWSPAHDLQVDEALLTGESPPSDRVPDADVPAGGPVGDRVTMLHGGTLVVHGSGTAVVTATGPHTELGRIAALLRERTAPATPLQRRLAALGRRLSVLTALGCAVVVAVGLLRGEPWELMVVAGISLAVATIPEAWRWPPRPAGWPPAARSSARCRPSRRSGR